MVKKCPEGLKKDGEDRVERWRRHERSHPAQWVRKVQSIYSLQMSKSADVVIETRIF